MEKIEIWYSIQNGGDGSAYPSWFLTRKEADDDQKTMYHGWGESCIGSVETFKGSDIHQEAIDNIDFIGMDIKKAEKICKDNEINYRIVKQDGDSYVVTKDYIIDRRNFTVMKNKITKLENG